jgi:hypothetical protein
MLLLSLFFFLNNGLGGVIKFTSSCGSSFNHAKHKSTLGFERLKVQGD